MAQAQPVARMGRERVSSPSDAKCPRTAASTARARVPGFKLASPACRAPTHASNNRVAGGRRPAADGERVGEIAPIARDDAPRSRARAGRPARSCARSAARLCRARSAAPEAKSPYTIAGSPSSVIAAFCTIRYASSSVIPGRPARAPPPAPASPARIERRSTSISSGSLDRRNGRISGPMSTISSPGRAARRPSTMPEGTLASSTPTRCARHLRQPAERRLRRAGPGDRAPNAGRRTRPGRPAHRQTPARGTARA